MTTTPNTVVLIPARSGSTRVPKKNIKLLGNKPLIGYQIETAIKSNVGRVIVSTDCKEIAEIASQYGAEVPFFRPKSLATSESSSLSAILHALKWLTESDSRVPDYIAFCPPTNPFLKPETIHSMVNQIVRRPEINSVVTITEAVTHPFRLLEKKQDGLFRLLDLSISGKRIMDIERTQDWPLVYQGSPACRLTRTSYFQNTELLSPKTYDTANFSGHLIDKIEAMDIDNGSDFKLAEAVLSTIQID
jgi:CMP-N,N'-diacetyllegionaminic acid synthase